jgi:hypothetical protein
METYSNVIVSYQLGFKSKGRSQVTLAKTEIIYPKNVGAQVAIDFT